MFTGIISNKYPVKIIASAANFLSISVQTDLQFTEGLKVGASVSVDGVCLTVTKIESADIYFDIITETLRVSTLRDLKDQDLVNLERSLKFGDEIGGHILSGHVDTTAQIVKTEQPENNYILTLKIAKEYSKYILDKGYIGINGVSLTVNKISEELFRVFLIPETLARTNLKLKVLNSSVNIEIDRNTQAIVDAVAAYLQKS